MTDIEDVLKLAWMYLETRNYQRAEDVLGSALATDPHNVRLLGAWARGKLDQDDFAAAEGAAGAALAISPTDEFALMIYAQALYRQNRLVDALDVCRDAVSEHPHSADAHFWHAEILRLSGDYEQALAAAEEALRLDPHDVSTMVLHADVLRDSARLDEAEAGYRDALRAQPDHVGAVHGLAATSYSRRRNWAAIYGFLGVARLDPRQAEKVRYNVGLALSNALRKSSWVILVVAVAVVMAAVQHADGSSTTLARTVAGLGAAVLLVTHARLRHHRLPKQTRKTIMRQRKMLMVRSAMLFGAVVAGAETAVAGVKILPVVLAGLLILAVPIVAIVAAVTGKLRRSASTSQCD